MKCPFVLKALRNSFLICLLVGGVASNNACAEAIETTFYKAETMLKKHPSQLSKFKAFKDRVHNQLRAFLDTNNKESYATHVGYMEQNVRDLEINFVKNPEFKCVKNLTTALHADLVALLTLLKGHVGKRSLSEAPTLTFSLLSYKHLLPRVILDKVGASNLPTLLNYRLSC